MSEKIVTSNDMPIAVVSKDEFQKEKFYFSFSSMSKLLRDPKLFYNDYILRQRKDLSGKHLDVGQLLHCLVLEPQNFDNKFTVLPGKVPTPALKAVIDNVWKLYGKIAMENNKMVHPVMISFDREFLFELEQQGLYQNLVDAKRADKNGNTLTGDQKRLEKVITSETEKYWAVLIEGEKKTIVDLDMVQTANVKAQLILSSKKAQPFITTDSIKKDLRMEMELQCELPGYPFGLKGIIDCVLVDHENETIYITDLKTTSKTVSAWIKDFPTSAYMYLLQVIVYKQLIMSLVPKDSKRAWKLVFTFLVIDKNNAVYPFKVSPNSLRGWEMTAKDKFDEALWHYEQHSYDLPMAYELGLVEL
jgi:hypothetical protein